MIWLRYCFAGVEDYVGRCSPGGLVVVHGELVALIAHTGRVLSFHVSADFAGLPPCVRTRAHSCRKFTQTHLVSQ
jgi:hypothetical protein